MKRLILLVVLAALVATPLAASPVGLTGTVQAGYEGSPYGKYEVNPGGEFTLKVLGSTNWLPLTAYVAGTTTNILLADVTKNTFQTFCIEGNEYIWPYNTTYTAEVQTYAENGGQSGQTEKNKDYVSRGTGWLYSQFVKGTLTDYDYNLPGRTSQSAALLQNAIWWLEGEEGISYTDANIFMKAVVAKFGSQGSAKYDGGWKYGVYALNIRLADGTRAQTQLWSDGIPVFDGGATLTLLGGALMGLGVARRKFRL